MLITHEKNLITNHLFLQLSVFENSILSKKENKNKLFIHKNEIMNLGLLHYQALKDRLDAYHLYSQA